MTDPARTSVPTIWAKTWVQVAYGVVALGVLLVLVLLLVVID